MAQTKANDEAFVNELEALAKRARVVDVLPYQYIGRAANVDLVHLLDDQSFGIGFEFSVPSVETWPGGTSSVSFVLDKMIRKLPAGYILQFYRKNSTDVSDYLELYAQQVGADAVGQAVARATIERWQQASKVGFFPGTDVNFFPCREELAVMIKAPPSKAFQLSAEQALAMLLDAEAPSPRYTKAAKEFSNVVRDIRETTLEGGIGIYPMGGDAFIPFVVTMMAPFGPPRDQLPRHSEVELVSEAISSAVKMDFRDNHGNIRKDRVKVMRGGETSVHRVVSMLWQPAGVAPGMCNDLMYKAPNINLVTTVRMLPQLMESLKIKAGQFMSSKAITAFNQDEAQVKQKSYSDVNKRLFAGEKICQVRFQALVTGRTDDEADEAVVRVSSAMDSLFSTYTEEEFGSSLFTLGSLPFMASEEREETFKRRRRMLSKDIAEMIPAGGHWRGVVPTADYLAVETNRSKPICMYANKVGGPLFVNSSLCDANPHILVAGGSGSGKTFFIQDLLMQMWRVPKIRAYLISIKPDYRRLSSVLGKFIDIDLDREDISINPLGGKPTKSNQERWTQAVSLMLSDGDPKEMPRREERVLIEDAVMIAAERNWDYSIDRPIKETILDDVVVVLKEIGKDMGENLAHRLKPYYSGAFRNLVNRPRTISNDDPFVFFNLAGVKESPCCAVVMFSLFSFINDVMYDPDLVDCSKVVVFDEGWSVMKDQYSAALMEKAARAYRSLGGLAVFISQSFKDFDSDLGRAILANTATKIILPQEQSELNSLGNYISLNHLEFQAVSALKLHKRKFSEFFVKMSGINSTTGRLIPDAMKYAIATTDPLDEGVHAMLLRETQGDYKAAVQRFAKEYPYGNAVAVH